MASGTLANLASSAFVPTRVIDAERICRNLLSLPAASFSILDPTSGEGHLLLPLAAHPRAQLYGVELSAERASESRTRLPRALVVTGAFEHVWYGHEPATASEYSDFIALYQETVN